MDDDRQDIIIYNTADGKASVALYAKDGMVWMNQNQLAKLFGTSMPGELGTPFIYLYLAS